MTTVGALARLVEGEVLGDAARTVEGYAALDAAGPKDVTFAAGEHYRRLARESEAGVVVSDAPIEGRLGAQILVDDPNLAFAVIVESLVRSACEEPGVHPRAEVHEDATVDTTAVVKAFAVVEAGARIGARSSLGAGCYLGAGATVGDDCVLHPRVTVLHDVRIGDRVILHPGVVLGADGFGYATDRTGRHVKIPQTGTVVIEDDVEIGAGTCVDRARFAETRIGRGTKIDNLVQVAHNVVVGPHSIIVSQAGIAGSTELGHHVVLGGHVGVAGHLRLGDGVQVSAFSGVNRNLEDGRQYMGIPARPLGQGKRIRVLEGRLPALFERLKGLERALSRILDETNGQGPDPA